MPYATKASVWLATDIIETSRDCGTPGGRRVLPPGRTASKGPLPSLWFQDDVCRQAARQDGSAASGSGKPAAAAAKFISTICVWTIWSARHIRICDRVSARASETPFVKRICRRSSTWMWHGPRLSPPFGFDSRRRGQATPVVAVAVPSRAPRGGEEQRGRYRAVSAVLPDAMCATASCPDCQARSNVGPPRNSSSGGGATTSTISSRSGQRMATS